MAQLIWQRHPERVSGLVLCATWSRFFRTNRERGVLRTIGRVVRVSSGGSGMPPGMGIEFDELTEADRKVIDRIVRSLRSDRS